MKRIVVAVILGGMFGMVCIIGGSSRNAFESVNAHIVSVYLLNRMLMGFVIGISNLRIPPLFHGACIGFIVSATAAAGLIDHPNAGEVIVLHIGAGTVYGLLTELILTKTV